jgi:hypothetical protein
MASSLYAKLYACGIWQYRSTIGTKMTKSTKFNVNRNDYFNFTYFDLLLWEWSRSTVEQFLEVLIQEFEYKCQLFISMQNIDEPDDVRMLQFFK